MKTENLTYVQELLKKFGTIIYTGNKLDDITIMELELSDLFEWKLITDEEYLQARAILSREYKKSAGNFNN